MRSIRTLALATSVGVSGFLARRPPSTSSLLDFLFLPYMLLGMLHVYGSGFVFPTLCFALEFFYDFKRAQVAKV